MINHPVVELTKIVVLFYSNSTLRIGQLSEVLEVQEVGSGLRHCISKFLSKLFEFSKYSLARAAILELMGTT